MSMSASTSRLETTDHGKGKKPDVGSNPKSSAHNLIPLTPLPATSRQDTVAVSPIRQRIAPGRRSTLQLEAGECASTTASPKTIVKLTPWRLLNTIFLLAVGTVKAVSAYQGHSVVPNTLDWIIGVVWALISFWGSVLEVDSPNTLSRFFDFDLYTNYGFLGLIRPPLVICAMYLAFVWVCSTLYFVNERWFHGQTEGIRSGLIVVTTMLFSLFSGVLVGLVCVFLGKFRVVEGLFKHISLPAQTRTLFSSRDWVVREPEGYIEAFGLILVLIIVSTFIFCLYRPLLPSGDLKAVTLALLVMGSLLIAAILVYVFLGLFRMAIRNYKRFNGQYDAQANTTSATTATNSVWC